MKSSTQFKKASRTELSECANLLHLIRHLPPHHLTGYLLSKTSGSGHRVWIPLTLVLYTQVLVQSHITYARHKTHSIFRWPINSGVLPVHYFLAKKSSEFTLFWKSVQKQCSGWNSSLTSFQLWSLAVAGVLSFYESNSKSSTPRNSPAIEKFEEMHKHVGFGNLVNTEWGDYVVTIYTPI